MLPNCGSSKTLGFHYGTFTGEGLACLGDCRDLQEFSALDVALADEDVAGLAELTHLEHCFFAAQS